MASASRGMATCRIKLNHVDAAARRILMATLREYRSCCNYLIGVVDAEWDAVSRFEGKKRLTHAESLVHRTKENPEPKYNDFDVLFYKMPSYYRRSAINYAIGQVSSYRTRKAGYDARRHEAISNGKRFREKPPVLSASGAPWPALYRKNTFLVDGADVAVKAYVRNTWDWLHFSLPRSGARDLAYRAYCAKRTFSPSLVKSYDSFYLVFPIEYEAEPYPKTSLADQKILAVDLGVNRGATACVMDSRGTVLKRFFDPFTKERDRMGHLINKIRKVQSETGGGNRIPKVYTKLAGAKENYARQLASWIARAAMNEGAYGVVFERLGRFPRAKRKADKIHHWCKRRIQELCRGICARHGIRAFFINPANTSALAYDGSGKVSRGDYRFHGQERHNYSICIFGTGKQYNCDLNAAYNIGARYFIRAYQKAMPETAWSLARHGGSPWAREENRLHAVDPVAAQWLRWAAQGCGVRQKRGASNAQRAKPAEIRRREGQATPQGSRSALSRTQ